MQTSFADDHLRPRYPQAAALLVPEFPSMWCQAAVIRLVDIHSMLYAAAARCTYMSHALLLMLDLPLCGLASNQQLDI
jgi:hypothetical protein